MIDVPGNVRNEIARLIPSSLINEIACFTFYDNHPIDEKNIDITICTKNGEVKEFFQRDCVSSIDLSAKPTSIRILRNNDLKLFYLIGTENELIILSSDETLHIYEKLSNISSYEVKGTACSGNSYLQVIKKDDAVPLYFNNDFESMDLEGWNIVHSTKDDDDNSIPVLNELKRKLIEARFISLSNENKYSAFLNLRQRVSMLSYQNLYPNLDAIFKDDNDFPAALKLKIQKPCVKVCNKKIVVTLMVFNENKDPLENIHILFNSTTPSLVYTTKLFKTLSGSPYWKDASGLSLNQSEEAAVIAVMDLEEMKLTVTSKVELSGYLAYRMSGSEYFLPFEDVLISSLESIGDEFDVLSNKDMDNNTILSVLASTEKIDLSLRHIRCKDEPEVSILKLFCTHLQMERVGSTDNVILYRRSPYHILNGTMIVFHESKFGEKAVLVTVHTRSSSQILALLHLMYDNIPEKIIATTTNYTLTAKIEELSHYNEEIVTPEQSLNYMDYASSILNRGAKILEHLDNSMIKMVESKNPDVLSKVGSHIDIFAGGVENFKEFRACLLDEAKKGIDSLFKANGDCNTPSDFMVID